MIPDFLHPGLDRLTRSAQTCPWRMSLIVRSATGGADSRPMLQVVSALEGGAALFSKIYPTTHFLVISQGTFGKALGFGDLIEQFTALALFVPAITLLCVVLLRKQEK